MTRIHGLLDPESAAVVVGAYDAATSPRRGGPRFVDPTEAARADAVAADPRTTEQIAVDSFVELIRIATMADPGAVLGRRGAAVQVLVTERDLSRRAGIGRIEGQPERGEHRHGRTAHLRVGDRPDPVRLRRAVRECGTGSTPVQPTATHRDGCSRWWMPLPGLRPSTLVDRGPSHRRVGSRLRQDGHRRRHPALPTSSSARARQRVEDHAHGRRLLRGAPALARPESTTDPGTQQERDGCGASSRATR